jgi:hypothetical protein
VGLFSKSVNEKSYLDNVLRSMDETRRQTLCPQAMYGNVEKDTGLVGSALASIVSLLMIARYITEAHPTRAAEERYMRAEFILNEARKDAWALSDMFRFNMDDAIAIGQEEADKYLQWAGGDVTLWHERGHKGHKEFRQDAVLVVAPNAGQVAEDRMFWGIINQTER